MFWSRQIWDFSLHIWGGFCPPPAVWPVWNAGVCMRWLAISIINMHIVCRGGIRKWNIWLLGTPCSLYIGYLLLTERIWSWRGWRVEVFKYLGRLLAYDDKDTKAMRVNLKKAWQYWAWISFVLRAENASPEWVVFFKATVQDVLLFVTETWNPVPPALKRLEGFHIWAAWYMTGTRHCREPNGSWSYPTSKEVLEEVGLFSITHYVGVRRQTITKHISLTYVRNEWGNGDPAPTSFGGVKQWIWRLWWLWLWLWPLSWRTKSIRILGFHLRSDNI